MKPSLIAQIAAPTEARRASYVAWLLRLDPLRVFPAGPESNAEADQHLVDTVIAQLEELTEQAARSGDYALTLEGEAATGAKQAQAQRRVVDEGFMECLEGLRDEILQWKGQWIVKTEAVYNRLGIPQKDRNGGVPRKVKEAMTALRWKPEGPVRIDGELCRIYVWAGDGNPAGLAAF